MKATFSEKSENFARSQKSDCALQTKTGEVRNVYMQKQSMPDCVSFQESFVNKDATLQKFVFSVQTFQKILRLRASVKRLKFIRCLSVTNSQVLFFAVVFWRSTMPNMCGAKKQIIGIVQTVKHTK